MTASHIADPGEQVLKKMSGCTETVHIVEVWKDSVNGFVKKVPKLTENLTLAAFLEENATSPLARRLDNIIQDYRDLMPKMTEPVHENMLFARTGFTKKDLVEILNNAGTQYLRVVVGAWRVSMRKANYVLPQCLLFGVASMGQLLAVYHLSVGPKASTFYAWDAFGPQVSFHKIAHGPLLTQLPATLDPLISQMQALEKNAQAPSAFKVTVSILSHWDNNRNKHRA